MEEDSPPFFPFPFTAVAYRTVCPNPSQRRRRGRGGGKKKEGTVNSNNQNSFNSIGSHARTHMGAGTLNVPIQYVLCFFSTCTVCFAFSCYFNPDKVCTPIHVCDSCVSKWFAERKKQKHCAFQIRQVRREEGSSASVEKAA